MPAIHYPCSARLGSRSIFFLWFTNDVDGTLFEHGDLVTFSSLQECIDFAEAHGLVLGRHEATVYDFDAVDQWIQHPEVSRVDAPMLLNMWNLIEDFLRSRGTDGDSFPLSNDDLYETLFYAINLPAITPPGKRFDPAWTSEQRRRIAATLEQPMSEFRTALVR